MLRIHFTADDLARTRVVETIGVAAETYLSLGFLRRSHTMKPFHIWQTSIQRGLDPRVRPLNAIFPRRGPAMDLHALTGGTASIEEAADRLRTVTKSQMRSELHNVALEPASKAWATSLCDTDPHAVRALSESLTASYDMTVQPHWAKMRTHLGTVRSTYAHAVLDGGIEQLLSTMYVPSVRWNAPVLKVDSPQDADLHLKGRGLTLAPVIFAWRQCQLLLNPLDDTASPILTIPTVHDHSTAAGLWGAEGTSQPSLAALVGRTRAAALEITATGCSTTDLARRLNVSAGAASQHATILRNAHLITTVRRGGAVLHQATPLGLELLNRTTAQPATPRGRTRSDGGSPTSAGPTAPGR
ncbi:ArsR/SmtB family transcription factor [Streptomyces sp. NPDC059874]|uniref:ArsR/SmtB family transcription factor n=1 Tax=Streptomyces sp. NPDC059874 TaxID=3346983 RepID=UPI0036652F75